MLRGTTPPQHIKPPTELLPEITFWTAKREMEKYTVTARRYLSFSPINMTSPGSQCHFQMPDFQPTLVDFRQISVRSCWNQVGVKVCKVNGPDDLVPIKLQFNSDLKTQSSAVRILSDLQATCSRLSLSLFPIGLGRVGKQRIKPDKTECASQLRIVTKNYILSVNNVYMRRI